MHDDVVVTGMGVVSPAGVGLPGFWTGQVELRSGVRELTAFDAHALPARIGGEVDLPSDAQLPAEEAELADRCTQFAAAAAAEAVRDSGIDFEQLDTTRAGVAMGCLLGGITTAVDSDRALVAHGPAGVRGRSIPMLMANGPAAWIAIRYGLRGPCSALGAACVAGADALVAAHQMITSGEADVVLAGGAEAPLVPHIYAGFCRLGALSTRNDEPERASRPFSADRDGFVIGEGAAVLVLESRDHARARGAREHAVLAGYGRSADAAHMTRPSPDGSGAALAMTRALRSARCAPSDVGMVNAHGTGTKLNDAIEARALHTVFGADVAKVAVTSTKSVTGHSFGAAAAIEAVATVQALGNGVVPATANLDTPDPGLGVDVVRGAARSTRLDVALTNSFAMGGHNVVLAFTTPR